MANLYEPLEARQLLAFTGTFTDVDGDVYKVDLTGPGNVTLTTLEDVSDADPLTGAIGSLLVAGTTAASRLKISVTQGPAGNGRVAMFESQFSVLRSATMPAVDVQVVAEFFDVGQLTLGDLDGSASVSISVAQSSNNLGARTVAVGNIGNGTDLEFGEFLTKITMNDSVFADMSFEEGVGSLQSKNNLSGRLDADPAAVFSDLRAVGLFRVRANLGSDIKTIIADRIEAVPGKIFRTAGSIGAITVKTSNNGDFEARNFGKVTGATLLGRLAAFEPDGRGNTFSTLRFTGEMSGQIGAADTPSQAAGSLGNIASLTAGSFDGLHILAGTMGTVKVAQDFLGSSIDLQAPTGVVLKSLTVGGLFTQNEIQTADEGGIGAIRAQHIETSTFEAGFISSLRVGVGVGAGVQSTNFQFTSADPAGFALKRADFGESLINTTVANATGATGNFGSLAVRRIDSVTIKAATIGSLLASGTPGQFGDVMVDTQVVATAAPASGFSIGTLDLRGKAFLSVVRAAGSINRVSIAAIPANDTNLSIAAGASDFVTGFPVNLNDLLPTARINRITVSGRFVLGEPTFSGARFVAPAIGDITVNGLINIIGLDDGIDTFGFGARTFGKVTLKNAVGQTIKPVIPTSPGVFNPFDPTDPGNFKFVVYA